jgi:hypothetical protein
MGGETLGRLLAEPANQFSQSGGHGARYRSGGTATGRPGGVGHLVEKVREARRQQLVYPTLHNNGRSKILKP